MPTTVDDVRGITGSTLTDAVITSLISDAELVGGPCIDQYDAARKDAIIKWLAAHLVASTSTDGALSSESLGDASRSYARGQLGDRLRGTTYGQQALALDLNGCLARRGGSPATFEVV